MYEPELRDLYSELGLLADAHLRRRVVQQVDVVGLADVLRDTGTRSRVLAETDAGAQGRQEAGRDKERTPSAQPPLTSSPDVPAHPGWNRTRVTLSRLTDLWP